MKRISYIISFVVIIVYICSSCDYTSKTSENNIASSYNINTLMSKDAPQIENTFISIVESIRQTIAGKDSFEIYSTKDLDPANFFLPYAIRYNYKNNRYEASPFITSKQITVNVDTIVYNRDSLLCVALLGIEKHYMDLHPYEAKGMTEISYDGRVVIGCRDSINSPFKIFPFMMLSIVGYEDIDIVYKDLKNYYFHNIVGKIAPMGTNMEGDIYTCGLSDSTFFIDAPVFKLNKFGDYKFKYYLKGDKEFSYIYSGNDSIFSDGTNQ